MSICRFSRETFFTIYGLVAQLIERRICIADVAGLSPVRSTNFRVYGVTIALLAFNQFVGV
jgi:hypothetical protein